MQRSSSERIVLMCEECGEKLIILGPAEDWRSRCAVFVCECAFRPVSSFRPVAEHPG